MEITAIALAGMRQAESRVEASARRLNAGPATDSVDLSAEMVTLLASRQDFAANTKVVETAGEIEKSLLDILA